MPDSPYPRFTKTYHNNAYAAIDPSQPCLDCSDKIVLVTGAGRGIGKAIALGFARAHAHGLVLLGGRVRANLEETAAEIRAASDRRTDVFVAEGDITDAEQVKKGMDAAVEHFGGRAPDVLVENVGGVSGAGDLESLDVGEFMKCLDLNLRGPLNVLQAFMRACTKEDEGMTTKEGEEGKVARAVINVSSGAAHVPYAAKLACYSISKLAGAKLMEHLHHEKPHWQVVNMQPGVVATDLSRNASRPGPDAPELPAGFAVWLAVSPDARFLNGRFAWANWDVDELIAMKEEIERKDLLNFTLKGWADDVSVQSLVDISKRLSK